MPQDPREPLCQCYKLSLTDGDYVMREVIGYGGSCLAYSAKREPTDYERGIGMQPPSAVIKEFYPLELASSITREANGELRATPSATDFLTALQSEVITSAFSFTDSVYEQSESICPLVSAITEYAVPFAWVILVSGREWLLSLPLP